VEVRCQNSASQDYASLEKAELKKELKTRGLSISGGREQLIHRLHLSDAPPPVPVSETESVAILPAVAAENEINEIKEEEAAEPEKKTRAVRKKKTTAIIASDSSPFVVAAPVSEQQQEPLEMNEATLLKLAKPELQTLAVARGVAKSGTKAQIVSRIMEADLGVTVAADEAPSTAAAPKKRAVAKKKTTIAKKTTITDTEELKNSTATTTATTTTTITALYQRPASLQLSPAAVLKRDEALAAAVTVVTALNSKRRTLEMMEQVISVAVATTAAQNLKWAEQDQENKNKKIEQVEKKTLPISKFKKLSPDEAAKVLEEVVRRKGTGGIGLGTGGTENNNSTNNNKNNLNNNGDGTGNGAADLVTAGSIKQIEVASEVDSMKTVMAGLKERLITQEENTEQLFRASIQSSTATTAAATAATTAAATAASSTTPAAAAAPIAQRENMQATIDFALTLGKAISVVGREIFKSFMKKN
jgi:hypothetical protein